MGEGAEECSCLYVDAKGKGSPGDLKLRTVMEETSAGGSQNPLSAAWLLPLSPDTFSLPPSSQQWVHSQGALPAALPALPHFTQPLPWWRTQLQLQMWTQVLGGGEEGGPDTRALASPSGDETKSEIRARVWVRV